ncbi:MAG: chondroitinase-B domain-containing protein [Thermoanaerobacteraceae bacterium]
MIKKSYYAVLITIILIFFISACDINRDVDKNTIKYYEYHNDKGIGFFYPDQMEKLSGIAKIYGLAYTGEGWDEEDKGVGKVIVNFGDKKEMLARTYVKDRYWIRTFDTSEFKDGPLKIKVTAYDKSGNLIGTATNIVVIDNSNSNVLRKIYISPYGKPQNKGSIDSPWDINTGINNLRPGDVLFLREGVYKENIVLQTSGTSEHPITIMNFPGEKVELKEANIRIGLGVEHLNILGIDQGGLRQLASGVELGDSVKYIQF